MQHPIYRNLEILILYIVNRDPSILMNGHDKLIGREML